MNERLLTKEEWNAVYSNLPEEPESEDIRRAFSAAQDAKTCKAVDEWIELHCRRLNFSGPVVWFLTLDDLMALKRGELS